MSIPLGKEESTHLEFEDWQALATPGIIAREVVAMLNAGGGEIWIVRQGGSPRAVDTAADAARGGRALKSYLQDNIEPSPAEEEIMVEVDDSGKVLGLCLRLQPVGGRGPYAYLEGGGRHFLVRHGSHTRWMHRNEIFGDTGEDRVQ